MANNNYYGGLQPNPIVSMFNPEIEAGMNQSVMQRQGRFDTAVGAVSSEIARIGDIETADRNELTGRLDSFEKNINSLVNDKYGGDYSAAAPELTKAIAQERRDPFYTFNKDKVAYRKMEQQAKMKLGANYMSAKSPMDVSYDAWQQGETFDFTPVNREDIVKQSAMAFQGYAKQVMDSPELMDTPKGRFIMSKIQSGFKNEQEIREFMGDNPELMQGLMSNPAYQGLNSAQVEAAIFEGAHAGMGQTQINFMGNPDYMTAYQKAQINAKNQNAFIPGLITRRESIDTSGSKRVTQERRAAYMKNNDNTEDMNKIVQEKANELGFSNVKTYDDLITLVKEQESIVPDIEDAVANNAFAPSSAGLIQVGRGVSSLERANSLKNDINNTLDEKINETPLDIYEINDLLVSVQTNPKLRVAVENLVKSFNNKVSKGIISQPEVYNAHTTEGQKAKENFKQGTVMLTGFATDKDRKKIVLTIQGEINKKMKEFKYDIEGAEQPNIIGGYIDQLWRYSGAYNPQ